MSMRDGQNEIRPGVLYAVAATATVITAVLLRFQQFSVYPGLNGDEADLASRAQDVITLGEGWLTVSGFFAPYALALSALSTPWFDDPLLGVRLPFAIVELLGVPVAWVLFRMTTDRTTALYAALLLLTMPVFMVMSRIAWEPSFVPVASVLVFSAVLARRFVLASALLLLAMLAHPIIVFIAPIVFLAWAGEIWRHGRIRSRETLVMIVLGVLVAAAALGAFLLSTTAQTITASGIEEPVLSVGNIVGFLKSIGEFASGVRAYESVAGRPPLASVLLHDAVALMVVLLAGLGLLWRLPEQAWVILPVLGGLAIGLMAQHLMGGSIAARAENVRYMLWVSGPLVWCMAQGCRSLQERVAGVKWGVVGLCAAALLSFHTHFLQAFSASGGEGMFIYRAHPEGAEQFALQWLREHTPLAEGETIQIGVAHVMHTRTLKYLAEADELDIIDPPRGIEWNTEEVERELPPGSYFIVSPYPDPLHSMVFIIPFYLDSQDWAELVHIIAHPSGAEILRIYRLGGCSRQSVPTAQAVAPPTQC